MPHDKAKARLSTVDHAVSFLALFLQQDSVGLVDVERHAGISKTAAFRLAATMVDRGLLTKDSRTKQYRVGPLLYQLARNNQRGDLVTVARRIMPEVAEAVAETVCITIRTEYQWVVLDALECTQIVRVAWRLGQGTPLYVGAPGKLHLAYMPPNERSAYFRTVELKELSPNTITDPDQLRSQLETIRRNGYAVSNNEANGGAASVSVPIWGSAPEPLASLCVMLPASRMTDEKQASLAELLPNYAMRISQALQAQSD